MDAEEIAHSIIGNWSGKMFTYEQPEQLMAEGIATAYVKYRLDRKVIEMEYTHNMKEEEHSAILIFSLKSLNTSWIDTFHTNSDIMNLKGEVKDNRLIFNGEYSADDEIWGWKIELYEDDGTLHFKHYNLPPEGEIYLGVNGEFEISDDEDSLLTDYDY